MKEDHYLYPEAAFQCQSPFERKYNFSFLRKPVSENHTAHWFFFKMEKDEKEIRKRVAMEDQSLSQTDKSQMSKDLKVYSKK